MRTGAHIQEGDVFADGIAVADGIHNHEIYDAVLRYCGAGAPPAAEATAAAVAVSR